jgi:uncharacterized protein (TIGR03086 family)
MRDLVDLHRRAVEEFGRRVREVSDDQWRADTPCSDWDVRELVNHLVNENKWTVELLDGKAIADVGDRLDGDLLGDDPKAAWEESAREATASASEQGALDRTVHVSFGDIPGRDYISQLTLDHVIHSWDLARGIGGEDKLDPELVEFAYEYFLPQVEAWRQAGALGPAVEVPDDSDKQAKLLGISGRDPR